MHHAINEYQLRLDVQCFLWPVYYLINYAGPLSCILGCNNGKGIHHEALWCDVNRQNGTLEIYIAVYCCDTWRGLELSFVLLASFSLWFMPFSSFSYMKWLHITKDLA